jgi:hypothetical protein
MKHQRQSGIRPAFRIGEPNLFPKLRNDDHSWCKSADQSRDRQPVAAVVPPSF